MSTHALVLGGSIAGLLAGRVLSKFCDRVTIIDRDTFPSTRRSVPQGRHTHGLLAVGREVLEEFFPGISQELISAGAVFFHSGIHSRF